MIERQPILRTDRLELRRWQDADLEPFAAINADPEVMRYFPRPLDRAASDALVERTETQFETLGHGLWAVVLRDTGQFLGFTGLARQTFDAPFNPSVEVGWRLARSAWGSGYATEAARAAVDFGFERVGLDEIVSLTYRGNDRSRAVMRRLGMTRDPADDFDHPGLPRGHPLRPHVLCRLRRPASTAG